MVDATDRKILLAEDDLTCQIVTVRLIEKMNIGSVSIASNGREALEMVKSARFDLVLMDEQMPVMGGIEAVARIREHEKMARRSRVPIIALTALCGASRHDRSSFRENGMDGCISKPLNPEKLRLSITALTNGLSEEKPESVSNPGAKQQNSIDIDELMVIMNNSRGLLLRCMESFSTTYRQILDRIEHSIAEKNSGDLKKSAHRLKGSLQYLAARKAADMAEELERMASDNNIADSEKVYASLVRECETVLKELQITLNRNMMD